MNKGTLRGQHAVIPGGQLLGKTQYAPAAQVTFSISSSTATALDSANVAVTFVVPQSGAVVGVLCAYAVIGGTSGLGWGVLSNGLFVPTSGRILSFNAASAATEGMYMIRFSITGLTPGATLTWAWAQFRTSGASTCSTRMGGDALTVTGAGPGLMEVYAA